MTWPVEQLTQEVSTRLATLGPLENSAFSASCAERLMPLYEMFCVEQTWDHEQQLRGILDDVWTALSEPSRVAQLNEAIHRLEKLVLHADDFNSTMITAAQDCVICTDIAVRWLLGHQPLPSVSPIYTLLCTGIVIPLWIAYARGSAAQERSWVRVTGKEIS